MRSITRPLAMLLVSLGVVPSHPPGARVSAVWSGAGTAAVVMRSQRSLVAGVDSKETYRVYQGGSVSVEDRTVCKVARVGEYFAMVAGLDRGSSGFDALRIARQTARNGDNMDALATRLQDSVTPALTRLLEEIRTAAPEDFQARYAHQPALELSLVGFEDRVPKVLVIEYLVGGLSSSGPKLSVRTTRCPGDCVSASTAYFLGEHAEIDAAVRNNPRLISPPQARNAETLIEIERRDRPELVGGPAAILALDKTGSAIVQSGACSSSEWEVK